MTVLDAASTLSQEALPVKSDHAERLRAGATQQVLPFQVMAPSTLGTFLRSFTFGHIRQLDAAIAETIRRAWALGAGPGSDAVTIDLDSTICEVHGKQKQGAAYGYTRAFGYHPILATQADTGEILHARLRKGSSQRGHQRFVEELIARVRRAGATGALTVRGDSGFWSYALIDTLHRVAGPEPGLLNQERSVSARFGGDRPLEPGVSRQAHLGPEPEEARRFDYFDAPEVDDVADAQLGRMPASPPHARTANDAVQTTPTSSARLRFRW